MSVPMKEKIVVTESANVPETFTFGSIYWIKIKAMDGTIIVEDSSTPRTEPFLEKQSSIDSRKKVESMVDSSQGPKKEFNKKVPIKPTHVSNFQQRKTQMESGMGKQQLAGKVKNSKCKEGVEDNKVKDKKEASTCEESSQDNIPIISNYYDAVISIANTIESEPKLPPMEKSLFLGMDIDKWKEKQNPKIEYGQRLLLGNEKVADNLHKFNRAIANSSLMHHTSKHKPPSLKNV